MVKRPTGPFWDASHHTPAKRKELKDALELNPERDKDNADKRIPPPRYVMGGGEINRAPHGASGTRRNLPTPEHQKARQDFDSAKPDSLKREFQPIARGQDKGHER